MQSRFFNNLWKCLCICYLLTSWSLYATWSSPVDLSVAGQNADIAQIAVDPNGNATAVWRRSDGANNRIQASTKLIGGSWQAVPDNLSAAGQNANTPQIATDDNGNATAVWVRRDGANFITQAATKPFGGSWQAVADDLSAAGQNAFFPQVAVDPDGNATAVWERSEGANFRIQASTKPFGGSWQAVPDNLSTAGNNATQPQIVVDDNGNATAIWQSESPSVIRASTKPFGGSWQAVPDDLSAVGQNATIPQIAVDPDGNATVIWRRFDGANFRIQASTKPFGGSWQAVADNLSAAGEDADVPQIAVDSDGNATAIWRRFDGANFRIQAATKPFGGSWQAVADNLSAAGQNAFSPQIGVDFRGNVTAVWQRSNGVNLIIQAATKPFGGSWQAVPDNLSAVGQDATDAQIAVDPNGNANVVWQRSDGANTIIQSSEQLVAPEVLSLNPNEGTPAGGTVVTLTGIGFITTTAVDFGAIPALSFVINSDSSITATAPPGALGSTVNVIVTTSVGSSPASASNQYTYLVGVPRNLQGEQKSNRFLSQKELFNVITWTASSSPTVILYRIYREANLMGFIGLVAANAPLEFQDHNREKNVKYTYYVVSEDAAGNLSTASIITVYP